MTDTNEEFTFDVVRSILLGVFIRRWKMPKHRIISRRGSERIEAYSFPSPSERVHRFVTVGLSRLMSAAGPPVGCELLLVLPRDLGGATEDEVLYFLLDVAAYALEPGVSLKPGSTVSESPLAPRAWAARALLFDEARGEPEDVSEVKVGSDTVEVIWVRPIFEAEVEVIRSHGVESFDDLEAESPAGAIDPRRAPLT